MLIAAGIKAQKNKQQYGESPEGRTAITEKGQRYAYDRHQPDSHADINKEVKKKN